MLSEVLLEKDVDTALEHARVVDRDHADVRYEIPARLTAACFGGIHYVVGHEHERLEELDHPS